MRMRRRRMRELSKRVVGVKQTRRAIQEGRAAARGVDEFLMGYTNLE